MKTEELLHVKILHAIFQSSAELLDHQLKGLQWTVAHAYNGSPFYRRAWSRPVWRRVTSGR